MSSDCRYNVYIFSLQMQGVSLLFRFIICINSFWGCKMCAFCWLLQFQFIRCKGLRLFPLQMQYIRVPFASARCMIFLLAECVPVLFVDMMCTCSLCRCNVLIFHLTDVMYTCFFCRCNMLIFHLTCVRYACSLCRYVKHMFTLQVIL